MKRARQLPAGWYPQDESGVMASCAQFLAGFQGASEDFCSVVVPHAGWAFSGALACRAIARLGGNPETVVVVGGHLRPSDPLMVADEQMFDTPLGALNVDADLARRITESLPTKPDPFADNTVEIQLPLVAALHSMPDIVYVRAPPSDLAIRLGRVIADYAGQGARVAVVGSTDLTHYGPAYHFTEHGTGADALAWVTTENDARFISALEAMDATKMIEEARLHRCACSAGAAAAAVTFAAERGCTAHEIVGYGTSHDTAPGDSIVGYVAAGYRRPDGA